MQTTPRGSSHCRGGCPVTYRFQEVLEHQIHSEVSIGLLSGLVDCRTLSSTEFGRARSAGGRAVA
jgi:hypothetical protein